ncbi:unnamed protein product [Didymodactylos carnosus]|uniref:Uncharacterized protein n=1 Tax=Didymodactylos carnosus TaxID=1234261 RepID=A0A816BF22_9BILA|nr:unnamed protein product [Didymodactylos carnosus]CAF4491965.1 unnamed protein product [Didymodactylos carnosus]
MPVRTINVRIDTFFRGTEAQCDKNLKARRSATQQPATTAKTAVATAETLPQSTQTAFDVVTTAAKTKRGAPVPTVPSENDEAECNDTTATEKEKSSSHSHVVADSNKNSVNQGASGSADPSLPVQQSKEKSISELGINELIDFFESIHDDESRKEQETTTTADLVQREGNGAEEEQKVVDVSQHDDENQDGNDFDDPDAENGEVNAYKL